MFTFFLILSLPPVNQTTVDKTDGAVTGNPDYIAFVLVPVFFLLGLLGVVICHVLKRKGYRCTTAHDDEEECEDEDKDSELGGGKKEH